MNPRLLLITDRSDLAYLQAQMLVNSGIDVSVLNHTIARNKMSAAELDDYDLILLNLLKKGHDSQDICKKLRSGYYRPILLMIYECDEHSLLRAYEAGADDCLVQPLSIHVLLAKVKAWLRRSGIEDKGIDMLEAYDPSMLG